MDETPHVCIEWFRGFDGRYRCVECQQQTRPGWAEKETD